MRRLLLCLIVALLLTVGIAGAVYTPLPITEFGYNTTNPINSYSQDEWRNYTYNTTYEVPVSQSYQDLFADNTTYRYSMVSFNTPATVVTSGGVVNAGVLNITENTYNTSIARLKSYKFAGGEFEFSFDNNDDGGAVTDLNGAIIAAKDLSNFYRVTVGNSTTAGSSNLSIYKNVAGTYTLVNVTDINASYTRGNKNWIKIKFDPNTNNMSAWIRDDSGSYTGAPTVIAPQATAFEYGYFGFYSYVDTAGAGNLNVNYDDLTVKAESVVGYTNIPITGGNGYKPMLRGAQIGEYYTGTATVPATRFTDDFNWATYPTEYVGDTGDFTLDTTNGWLSCPESTTKSIWLQNEFSDGVIEVYFNTGSLSGASENPRIGFRSSAQSTGSMQVAGRYNVDLYTISAISLAQLYSGTTLLQSVAYTWTANTQYKCKIEAVGSSIKVYIAKASEQYGSATISVTNTDFTSGYVGLSCYSGAGKVLKYPYISINALDSTSTNGVSATLGGVPHGVEYYPYNNNYVTAYSPFSVRFNDTSAYYTDENYPVTTRNWSYQGTLAGNTTKTVFSTAKNPSATFYGTNNFSIKLNASNVNGYFESPQNLWFNLTDPSANFTSNVTIGTQYGLVVQFNDTSLGTPTTWNWSFGDGGTSKLQNPVYIYDVARKYNVSLNITYCCGISNTTKTDYINLTADADSYLKSWLHFNGTNGGTVFKGEEGLAWTPTSATTSTTQVKFGYSSGAFLAATSKITTPNGSASMLGSGDFTIEQWLYPTSTGNNQFVISKTTSAKNNGWGLYDTGSNVFAFYMGTSANNTIFTVTQDAWSHVAIERVSGNVTVYVNGVGVATRLFPGSYDTSGPLVYGDAGAGAIQSFRGYIDESRISTVSRWRTAFTAPVYEYAGILETIYPDINPDSTFRFKTDPTGQAIISNQTDGGTRNRTIQIQNIVFTNYITGTSSFDSDHLMGLEVNLNTSAYTDMTLISSSIDNTIGPDDLNQYGLVTFNVTRAGGFATTGAERKSIVDFKILYYNYSPPSDTAEEEVFGSGYLINTTTSKMYPVHNFISTPITYVPWDFYPNFTSDKTTGFAPLTVGFTDTTVGFPNRWNWSFGDGQWTNGTSQTPSHVYTTPGVYTVSMNGTIWQNMSIVNTSIKTGYITVTEPAPVANFAHVPSEGFYPLNVQFTDTSTNTPTSWNWSFGDGSLSTTTNPTHVYSSGGTYQVNLTVNNSNATYSSKLGYVEVWNYTSTTFSGTPVSGVVPLTVTFTDTSSNATNWSWIFGDGGTSIEQNPVYVYNTVGTYSVKHSANNTHHTSWHNESDYITVNPMIATATGVPTTGVVPFTVTFTGSSTGSPNTWYWSFGDGVTATTQSPTHSYTVFGSYDVNFKATNTSSGAFDWNNQSGYITALEPAPVANFTQNVTAGFYSLPVLFTDTSTNTPTGWNWSFGDGSLSTTQNPAHVYSSGGTYEVNLTVHNTNATYSSKLGSVEVWNYTSSGFTGTPTSGVVPLIVTFTDTSSNATNWTWTFGDGNTSIAKSPTFTYNIPGTYSVNHSANNTHDVSWTNRSSYITVTNASALLAQYNPWKTVSIWYPSGIYYNDTSLGTPISWNWTFGDGTNSTKQNPYKQWRAPGVYHVRLTVSNSYTTSSNSSWVQVLKWT